MNKLLPEQILDFYHGSMPRKIWEMDKQSYYSIRTMKDCNGKYLWSPNTRYEDMPGTLFNIPISISEVKCFRIKYIFKDGHEHIVEMDAGKEG